MSDTFSQPHSPTDADLVFLVNGEALLVGASGQHPTIPSYRAVREHLSAQPLHLIGSLEGRPCYAGMLENRSDLPPFSAVRAIRSLFGRIDDTVFWMATKAMHIVVWNSETKYCSRCGTATAIKHDELAKICSECGSVVYPRISPAIIAAIVRDDALLMLKHRHTANDLYALMAGFVEPGETLEQAVAREAFEETGIEVTDIRYFGSQPWAFTGALMVGFTARYAGGELTLQESEIRHADWFRAGALPKASVYYKKYAKCSISWHLMRWFVETYGG